ncbi:hypothetical protein [Ammoniphilus sp. CFH 90114]|uniref:hypothetical protein n=1 Tax=Ammoniphilus sp. CFH 90114 TaxID=2493665 RepID=UPI00100FFBD8|nr:hypothetical protein [Ammoniphilus sp. CFH 90114]RXT14865.1 hypothetical protein EIZ39_01240 [Ammoniphilus sp. CFH 90114]
MIKMKKIEFIFKNTMEIKKNEIEMYLIGFMEIDMITGESREVIEEVTEIIRCSRCEEEPSVEQETSDKECSHLCSTYYFNEENNHLCWFCYNQLINRYLEEVMYS